MTNAEDVLFAIIGGNIARLRKAIKPRLSQEHLAESLGLKRTSIVNLEAGRQKAPLETLYQIACELNVEIKDLIPTLDELYEAVMKK